MKNHNVLIAVIIAMVISENRVNSRYGSMEIEVPQDQKINF